MSEKKGEILYWYTLYMHLWIRTFPVSFTKEVLCNILVEFGIA
jgi:hypothetical protein